MLAVKQALELGYKKLLINGCLGGRLDQTYANMQILTYIAESGVHGILIGRTSNVTAIRNGSIAFNPTTQSRAISVFSAGDKAVGVTLKGLKYPLDSVTLTNTYPIGVSNEFTGSPAIISVENGTLIIIWDGGLQDLCET